MNLNDEQRRFKYGKLKVVAVISAKNEEKSIGEVISEVKDFVDEVLIVDGHSQDRTREVSEKAGAKVILDSGKGKGDGVRTGLEQATGDIVVLMDADGSHDPSDIKIMIEPILFNRADLVIGSRMKGGSYELHGDIGRFIRMTGSHILLLIVNYRWNVRLTDIQNGFRAIRRSVALDLKLKETSHTIEEEMVMKCLKKGYRVTEVPSREYERKYGQSTLNLWKDWYKFLWCILKNIF